MKYLVVLSIGLLIGVLIGNYFGERQLKLKHQAISLGHAQYNPTNANFEWKPIKP